MSTGHSTILYRSEKVLRKDLRYNTKRKEKTKGRNKQFHFFSKHPTKYNKEKYQKSRHFKLT